MFASHPIFSRVRAAARRWVCVVVAGPLLGCGDPPPVAVSSSADVLPRATAVPTGDSGPPSAPASVAAPGEGELLPEAGVPTPENARTFVDLVSQAKRAHVRRDGPILDPAGPGWDRVAQLGDRKSWLPPPRNESARLAWPEGIGTTLAFPVGPEGPALRTGSIFLKAIAPNQRVTLFLDDVSLGTVAVPTQGRAVTFSLPEGGLAPGEHRLRLWFRFTRFIGKQRTPGGIGPVVLSAETRPGDAPVAWTGAMTLDGQPRPALLAGPPSAWTFYVWLPEQAHFTAEAVTGPVAVEFRVVVQGDASDPVDVGRLRVEPNARRKVDLDLSRFARQPVRLVLETRAAAGGGASTLETSGWVSPALRMPPLPDVPMCRARETCSSGPSTAFGRIASDSGAVAIAPRRPTSTSSSVAGGAGGRRLVRRRDGRRGPSAAPASGSGGGVSTGSDDRGGALHGVLWCVAGNRPGPRRGVHDAVRPAPDGRGPRDERLAARARRVD
jgi:hypothetical protein